eukprot:TRINITY_DN3926_c0_g3_i1.p1 TRINITY_DN3926_c0_g3~~TRINITY_DN3926_c0_g3_i1.p1  ORF type:complete len:913 (-),score=190.66 TRINITY_DN3926_c0_g3_i1:266-3004(-)
MAPNDQAALAWLHDPLKETSTNELSLLGALSDDASILQVEAVSAFLSPIVHADHKNSRSKAAVGKPVYGAPTASEWSQDFTAERRRCGEKIREYKFKVAKDYFVDADSFGPVARSGFSTPRRSPPLTLPPQPRPGSGWMTSRPTSRELAAARARNNRSPAMSTIPGLSPARSPDVASPDLEAVAFPGQQTKQGSRDFREPPFVNDRPWMMNSPKRGLLIRRDTYMGNGHPEVTTNLESKSQVPRNLPRPPAAKLQGQGPVIVEAQETREKKVERATKDSAVTTEGGHSSLAETYEKDLKSTFKKGLLRHKAAEGGDVVDSTRRASEVTFAEIPGEKKIALESLSRQDMPAIHAKKTSMMTSRKSAIWKLNHKDSKIERLCRISENRRMKASTANDSSIGYRNRISKAEAEIALESFLRHFPSKGSSPWDTEAMVEALADFGIQAQVKKEKAALFAILKDFEEEKTSVGFNHFCRFIEECRSKLRAVRSLGLFQAWKRHDDDDSGTMDLGEVVGLLEDVGLTPKPGDEHKHVMSLISDTNTDVESGTITFPEVEYLMASVGEYMVRSRRKEERDVQAKVRLSADLFKEFRSQLLSLYTCYREMDDDNNGSLDRDEILNLLQMFGCLSRAMDCDKKGRVKEMVERQFGMSPTRSLRFVDFVRLIKNLREMEMEEKSDAIQTLFNQYDKDNSGDLSTKEICAILIDLDFQPRSLSEQGAMSQLIDEADADGSGQLNVQELLFLVQRISERMVQLRREEEYKSAKALNFTLGDINEFRRAFDSFDVSGDGYLSVSEVWSALSILRWKVNDAKFARMMEEADEDGSGQLDFIEFLTLLRKADCDMSTNCQKSHKTDEVKDDDGEGRPVSTGGGDSPRSGQDQSGLKAARRWQSAGAASSAVPGLMDQAIKTHSLHSP